MRNLYALGMMAALLMVGLAPSPESMFTRFGFILAALTVGYLVLRHRYKVRYALRLKRAFNNDRHRDLRIEAMYRRERKLQTA